MKLRALVLVVLTLTLAGCSSQTVSTTTTVLLRTQPLMTEPIPAVDLSATPAGWVPVAYGDAQVSVPAGFNVFYLDSECSSILRPGTVLVGDGSVSNCSVGTIQPNGTLVHFHPLTRNPAFWRNEKPMRLNGLSVYLGPGMDPYLAGYGLEYGANDYIVPSLGIEVAAVGPLAKQVLNTLTRSPRVVVLAPGSSPVVPSSWQQVTFAGLHFSVPAGWPISRTSGAASGLGNPCETPGVAFFASGVTLSTDTHLLPPNACASGAYSNAPPPPMDGVQVDSGSHLQFHVKLSFSAHCLDLHGLTACPATSPAYSILVLRVTVPGHRQPVYVSIGLAGNGVVARTILYSLRAASSSETLGFVTGSFVAVGGPAPGSTRPLPGQVTAQNSAGHKFTVAVGKSGKFVLWLPAGVYRLTGRSPMFSVNGAEGTCAADQPVRVRAGKKTLGVEVVCPLK